MSRIGNKIITLPAGVSLDISAGNLVTVNGPKGTLSQQIDQDIMVEIEGSILTVKRPTEQKRHKAMHGLYRSLINNMVEGVSNGYTKQLELVGVGYTVSFMNNMLTFQLGRSHPDYFAVPSDVTLLVDKTKVTVSGTDKQRVHLISAQIRDLKKPEPYKGKGILYVGEVLRRKKGKKK